MNRLRGRVLCKIIRGDLRVQAPFPKQVGKGTIGCFPRQVSAVLQIHTALKAIRALVSTPDLNLVIIDMIKTDETQSVRKASVVFPIFVNHSLMVRNRIYIATHYACSHTHTHTQIDMK